MNFLSKIAHSICPSCFRRNRRTVKYAFPIVLTSLAFLGAVSLTTVETSYIKIEASAPAVRAGEWFYVDVYAYAHVPVNAVDVTLEFPEDQIEILGIDTGESVITIWTEDPYVEGNKIHLTGGTYRKGFLGEHLIATVNMEAKQTGMAELSTADVRLLAGDGSGTAVPASTVSTGEVSLVVVDADTDPSTIDVVASIKIVTDLDGDGKVTLSDISAFMAAWFDRSSVYDFNGDGKMTFRDFSIILADSFRR